jgi:hypothetical protein
MPPIWLLKILGPVLIISLLFAHDRRVNYLRGEWQHKTTVVVAVTAEVAGIPKLKVKDAPAAIRQIGRDRDDYLRRLVKANASLKVQTDRVIAMGEETARLRDQATAMREQVRKLTAQRDGWIHRASAAATRTERRSFQAEATECQAAMDTLYEAGF